MDGTLWHFLSPTSWQPWCYSLSFSHSSSFPPCADSHKFEPSSSPFVLPVVYMYATDVFRSRGGEEEGKHKCLLAKRGETMKAD